MLFLNPFLASLQHRRPPSSWSRPWLGLTSALWCGRGGAEAAASSSQPRQPPKSRCCWWRLRWCRAIVEIRQWPGPHQHPLLSSSFIHTTHWCLVTTGYPYLLSMDIYLRICISTCKIVYMLHSEAGSYYKTSTVQYIFGAAHIKPTVHTWCD